MATGASRQVVRIALLMPDDAYCRGVARGVHEYARPQRPWMFHRTELNERRLEIVADWQPAAVIGNFPRVGLRRLVEQLGVPVVNIGSATDPAMVTVCSDNEAVGVMQARHLIERGFTHLACFRVDEAAYADARAAGFVREAEHHRIGVDVYQPDYPTGVTWRQMDAIIRDWLLSLPKPVGIAGARDAACRILSEVAWEAGLRIPDDVALIGVDDDEVACRMLYPPLSSVRLPVEKIGFEAAATVDRLLHGRPVEPLVALPPLGVSIRASTDVIALDEPIVSEAVRLIREHADQPYSVDELLHVLAVSRRSLEMKFRKCLGRTPLQEIRRQHIERAKELLISTDQSMEQVAENSGFASASVLSVTFRKETGQTPTAYRSRNRRR